MFADSFDVAMTDMLDVLRFVRRTGNPLTYVWPSSLGARGILPKDVIFRVRFFEDLYVSIGPSFGSLFWVPLKSNFNVPCVIQRPTLTLDHLFDEKYYNQMYRVFGDDWQWKFRTLEFPQTCIYRPKALGEEIPNPLRKRKKRNSWGVWEPF